MDAKVDVLDQLPKLYADLDYLQKKGGFLRIDLNPSCLKLLIGLVEFNLIGLQQEVKEGRKQKVSDTEISRRHSTLEATEKFMLNLIEDTKEAELFIPKLEEKKPPKKEYKH